MFKRKFYVIFANVDEIPILCLVECKRERKQLKFNNQMNVLNTHYIDIFHDEHSIDHLLAKDEANLLKRDENEIELDR